MWNILGSIIGGGLSWIGGNEQRDDVNDAERMAMQNARLGFNYLRDDPTMQSFRTGGGRAFNARQALLGLGGDEEAASAAFDNYLDSTGFNFALDTGRDAITGSRAARGLLDSGATAEQLTQYGDQLGRQAFNNYLGQLSADAGMGLNATLATGQAGSDAGLASARINAQSGLARADVTGNQYNALGDAFGDAIGSFF